MADNVAITAHFAYRTNILISGKPEVREFCTKCGTSWPCDAAEAQAEIARLRVALTRLVDACLDTPVAEWVRPEIGIARAALPVAPLLPYREIGYTAEECERDMRRMTKGERGCSNPYEHEGSASPHAHGKAP